MKYFKLFLLSLSFIAIFATSLKAQENDLNVRIDAAQDIDFTNYDSYFWVTDFGNSENLWITVNSIQGEMIENAVEYEMDVKHIEWNPEDPDLLVNFHIFDEGYDEEFYTGAAPYEYRYMKKKDIIEEIEDGTVVISMIDKAKGEAVWEGYATIAVDESESLRQQQADIRQAVSAIFERYNPEGLSAATTVR